MTRPVIIDVDTGIDDALALMMLVSAASWKVAPITLLGVVASYGNIAQLQAEHNTRRVLTLCQRDDVPVLSGAAHPSWAASFVPDAGCATFHGTDGLGSTIPTTTEETLGELPVSIGGYRANDIHAHPANPTPELIAYLERAQHAAGTYELSSPHPALSEGARFVIDALERYGKELTVITTGPLTLIDQVLRARPDLAPHLNLVSMGGAVATQGNCYDLVAETNMIHDPHAAHRVFRSGATITLVGLDVTHQVLLSTIDVQTITAGLATDTATFFTQITGFSIAANAAADPAFAAGMPLHDPLAVAVALDPTLATTVALPLVVETETADFLGVRGRTTTATGLLTTPASTVNVALGIEVSRAKALITNALREACGR